VRADVNRHSKLRIRYCDENFVEHEEVYDGMAARIIQHEYDHIEGILFTDHISTLKKTLIKKRLQNIMDGKIRPEYKMKFINKKGR
jgi:peptide deformylase